MLSLEQIHDIGGVDAGDYLLCRPLPHCLAYQDAAGSILLPRIGVDCYAIDIHLTPNLCYSK